MCSLTAAAGPERGTTSSAAEHWFVHSTAAMSSSTSHQQQVSSWLTANNLAVYTDKFLENGYDDLEFLCDCLRTS